MSARRRSSGRGRPAGGPAPRRPRHPLWWGLLAVAVLALAATAWLGVRGARAADDLQAVRDGVQRMRSELLAGDGTAARAALPAIQRHAASAHALTSDPLWRLAASVPGLGATPRAAAAVASAADVLATQALPPLADVATVLDPAVLRPAGDRIDVTALGRATDPLARATAGVTAAQRALGSPPTRLTPARVDDAVTALRDQLDATATTLRYATAGVSAARAMLGGGPQTYFVGFQTNAEARGGGGLLGAYALLRTDAGRISVARLGPRSALDAGQPGTLPVDLGPDFVALYGQDPAWWVNANMSPHFPSTARLWLALWRHETGQRLDGALATDPVALSYLLAATGPVTLADGRVVSADTVVALTESRIYALIPHDDRARDAYLQQIAGAVVTKALGGAGDPTAVLDALGRAVSERRLTVWSAHPAVERLLAATPAAGLVPSTAGPYAGLVVNNAGGNKLDYYLARSLDYTALSCGTGGVRSRITVRLTNDAPASGLPPYVTQRVDRSPTGTPARPVHTGTNRLRVQVYAADGALLTGATLDGAPLPVGSGQEQGHPVYVFDLELAPGATATAVLDLREPPPPAGWDGTVGTLVNPLVKPATVRADAPVCSGSAAR